MTKKLVKILAPIVVIAASAGAYTLLQATRPEPEKNAEGPRPTSVYTATVSQQATALEVITQGEVRSRTEIDLVSQVGGRVVSVSPEFIEGGRIEPGVPLLQIEDTDEGIIRIRPSEPIPKLRLLMRCARITGSATCSVKQLT